LSPATHRFFSALAWSAVLLGVAPCAWGQEPDATESEFWRSAERIGTEAAYTIYLTRYPSGVFAPLAKAALDKLGAGAMPTVVPPAPSPSGDLSRRRAQLTSYKGDPESGAIDFMVGDRFYGPGTIQIGRWGARKQLLIPNGEWVALAAVGRTAANSITMVSAALGQFDGSRLRSLLVVDTNSWKVPVRPNLPVEWKNAKDCEREAPRLGSWHEVVPGLPVGACMDVGANPADSFEQKIPPGLWTSVLDNLSRLAIGIPRLSFNVSSAIYFTDDKGAYFEVRRFDCFAQGDCVPDSPAPTASQIASRVAWVQAYRPIAAKAFDGRLVGDELEPSPEPAAYRLEPPHKIVLPD